MVVLSTKKFKLGLISLEEFQLVDYKTKKERVENDSFFAGILFFVVLSDGDDGLEVEGRDPERLEAVVLNLDVRHAAGRSHLEQTK